GTQDDPLQPLAPPPAYAPEELRCDVLVVGAGPAGVAAALAARRAGADVLVIDERVEPGGQFYKPLAPSHQARRSVDAQFAAGQALCNEVAAAGVQVLQGAQAWAAFGAHEVGILHGGHAKVARCRQLVIAAGAYERPMPFPGWTLPGVMTTGAGQTLARAYRVAPGQRVLVAGNGPLNLQLAAELLLGCRQRYVPRHLGYLAIETDDEGLSSVPGVFVVGDGAELGGSRVALARGTLAGAAAARGLGLASADPRDARVALRRAEAFQRS